MRSDARKALAAKRTQAEPEPNNALADALHARIDGDWLLGGGGWGPDGWVDDIPHDKARISDLVRWAVNAIGPAVTDALTEAGRQLDAVAAYADLETERANKAERETAALHVKVAALQRIADEFSEHRRAALIDAADQQAERLAEMNRAEEAEVERDRLRAVVDAAGQLAEDLHDCRRYPGHSDSCPTARLRAVLAAERHRRHHPPRGLL